MGVLTCLTTGWWGSVSVQEGIARYLAKNVYTVV